MDPLNNEITHCTKKKCTFEDLRHTKRLKIDEIIQQKLENIGTFFSRTFIPKEILSQFFIHLPSYDHSLVSLSLVCKAFHQAFKMEYHTEIAHFQHLLKKTSLLLKIQSEKNLDRTELQSKKYALIDSKLNALNDWMQGIKSHLNKNEKMDSEQFLLIDAKYTLDPYENLEDKDWFLERGPECFLSEFLDSDSKINFNKYKFLFIHCSQYFTSSSISYYIESIGVHFFLECETAEEIKKIDISEWIKQRLFVGKIAYINFLESLEELDYKEFAEEVNIQKILPKGFENIFLLIEKEKEIRSQIFQFLNGKFLDRNPKECFSHFFKTVHEIYQLGEKEHALYLAAFLPAFFEDYSKKITKKFSEMNQLILDKNQDYVFALRFSKSMYLSLYLTSSIMAIGELESILQEILQHMLITMPLDQAGQFLSEKIDWNMFFETIEIEQGIPLEFINALTEVSKNLNIQFNPSNIDLVYISSNAHEKEEGIVDDDSEGSSFSDFW